MVQHIKYHFGEGEYTCSGDKEDFERYTTYNDAKESVFDYLYDNNPIYDLPLFIDEVWYTED